MIMKALETMAQTHDGLGSKGWKSDRARARVSGQCGNLAEARTKGSAMDV